MRYKKIIKGTNGIDYEISSDIDCLNNISIEAGYIGGFSIDTLYSVGSVCVKEIKSKPEVKLTETSFEHILKKQRKKRGIK